MSGTLRGDLAAVVRFGVEYKQWNTVLDAGQLESTFGP